MAHLKSNRLRIPQGFSSSDSDGEGADNEPILLQRNFAQPKSPISIRSVSPGAFPTSGFAAQQQPRPAARQISIINDIESSTSPTITLPAMPEVAQVMFDSESDEEKAAPTAQPSQSPHRLLAATDSDGEGSGDHVVNFGNGGDDDDDDDFDDDRFNDERVVLRRPLDASMTEIEVEAGELNDRTMGVGMLPGSNSAGEHISMSGRTREEWKRDSKKRRRQKRKKRRQIAQRKIYIWAAVGFVLLGLFITGIVLLYKSTSSVTHTPNATDTATMTFVQTPAESMHDAAAALIM